MLCPHCLQASDLKPANDPEQGRILRCSNPLCEHPNVPILYGEDYSEHPPTPLCIIGLSGHGKTVFIESLLQEIQQLGSRWNDSNFFFTWLDEVQMRTAYTRLRDLRQGKLPKGTRTVFPRPQVLRLSNIPAVGGSQLLIFDNGGEAFLDSTTLSEVGRYICHTSAVVWLLSLKKGDPYDSPDDVNQMMTVYLQTMSRLGGNTREQTLILVLTKGDELLNRPDLPESARVALSYPNYAPSGQVWAMLEQSSNDLENWLRSEQCGYHNLVNLVKSRFKAVKYCIVSAQGAAAKEGSLQFSMMPRGVLAPLLWLWRLQRDLVWVEVNGQKHLHLDLADAVKSCSGGVVQLEEATYRLDKPLNLREPIQFIGRGASKSIIEVRSPGYGIGVGAAHGMIQFHGLTIRRAGTTPGDLVRVLQGQAQFQDCLLAAALSGNLDGKTIAGTGLLVGKTAKVRVQSSTFKSNHGNGVLFLDQASGVLQDCLMEGNGEAGLFLRTTNSVHVHKCLSRANQTGFWIEAVGQGQVEECLAEQNGGSGFVASGQTSSNCVLVRNQAVNNRRDGIVVRQASSARIVQNSSSGNARSGLALTDQSQAVVRENVLSRNAKNGLRVADDAAPTLEANTVEENMECGILYEDRGAGVASQNTCRDNQGDGIRLEGIGLPKIVDNRCLGNGSFGLAVANEQSKVEINPKTNQLDGNKRGPLLDVRTKKGGGWWNRG